MPPVEIQWCDHSSVLLEYLRQLYDEGRFVDVGLECEGRQVKAHKAVISACSPYLEGLLKGNPARSHLIKFNGYSYKSLHAVIDFMYNGSVLVEQDQLAAFLKLGRALQVRGILDIAAQCEEAGLTTAEETKSNAQYSTTVQQSQKQQQQMQQQTQSGAVKQQQGVTESKKYAFMLDKQQTPSKKAGAPQQQHIMRKPAQAEPAKMQPVQVQQQQQQQLQQQQQIQQQQQQQQQQQEQQQQQIQQEQVQQQAQLQAADGSDIEASTLEEIQQALASGQALLQTDGTTGDQTLQMVEGQCVVTGSGQTYVVVQEGDNISFVPAEMVQGDLQAAVNGGQVMEGLDPVEQQLAQMEGQSEGDNDETQEQQTSAGGVVTTSEAMSMDSNTAQEQLVTSSEGNAGQPMDTAAAAPEEGGGESLETMSVVESLVKLGEKQPDETAAEGGGSVEVGPDMPSLDVPKTGVEGINEDAEGAGEDETSQQQKEGESSPQRRSSSEWSQQGVAKKPKLS